MPAHACRASTSEDSWSPLKDIHLDHAYGADDVFTAKHNPVIARVVPKILYTAESSPAHSVPCVRSG